MIYEVFVFFILYISDVNMSTDVYIARQVLTYQHNYWLKQEK